MCVCVGGGDVRVLGMCVGEGGGRGSIVGGRSMDGDDSTTLVGRSMGNDWQAFSPTGLPVGCVKTG